MPEPVREPSSRFAWTFSQRCALLAILSAFCVFVGIRYALNPTFVDDPQPDVAARSSETADKMDPNTATWQDLSALPNLGEKRAKAIVAYRDSRRAIAGQPVFRSSDDLMLIRGIGYSMSSKLKPYLCFPTSTTHP